MPHSLRTRFIGMTAPAGLCGWLVAKLNQARARHMAVLAIRNESDCVQYDYE